MVVLFWSGLVWSDLVWWSVVWCGLVWSGVVWYGLVWSGFVAGTLFHTSIVAEVKRRDKSMTEGLAPDFAVKRARMMFPGWTGWGCWANNWLGYCDYKYYDSYYDYYSRDREIGTSQGILWFFVSFSRHSLVFLSFFLRKTRPKIEHGLV